MSNAPATANPSTPAVREKPGATIESLLRARMDAMAGVLPRHLSADRLLRLATFDIARNPKLLQCSKESLVACVLQCAQLGLEPGVQGLAYLVPYGQTCTLVVGYRGLVALARRSGEIATVQAFVIHEGDEWRYQLGLNPDLHHVPADTDEPGSLVAAYAVCRLKDGSVQWDIMRKSEIDAIRKRSRASGSGPWVTDYDEMAKKTVLRRLCKLLPLSVEARLAVEREAVQESGGFSSIELATMEQVESGAPASVVIDNLAAGIESEKVEPAANAAKAAAKARKPPKSPASPLTNTAGIPTPAELGDLVRAAGSTEPLVMTWLYAEGFIDESVENFRGLTPDIRKKVAEQFADPGAAAAIAKFVADYEASAP